MFDKFLIWSLSFFQCESVSLMLLLEQRVYMVPKKTFLNWCVTLVTILLVILSVIVRTFILITRSLALDVWETTCSSISILTLLNISSFFISAWRDQDLLWYSLLKFSKRKCKIVEQWTLILQISTVSCLL